METYKILYNILLVFLFYSCSNAQPSCQINKDSIPLIDTIIDGNRIQMNVYSSDSTSDPYLSIHHNDLRDSLILKDYYSDIDYKESLVFMDEQKRIINTWIAKTNNLIIFVLPYYPAIGLYAYKVENNKINFVTTSENLPIYSDYAFFARFDSDMITSCYQPSARNTHGATIWRPAQGQNKFEILTTVAYETYLVTDNTKFINILNSIYNENPK